MSGRVARRLGCVRRWRLCASSAPRTGGMSHRRKVIAKCHMQPVTNKTARTSYLRNAIATCTGGRADVGTSTFLVGANLRERVFFQSRKVGIPVSGEILPQFIPSVQTAFDGEWEACRRDRWTGYVVAHVPGSTLC